MVEIVVYPSSELIVVFFKDGSTIGEACESAPAPPAAKVVCQGA